LYGDVLERIRIVSAIAPDVAEHAPEAPLIVPASLVRLFSRLGVTIEPGDLGFAPDAIDRLVSLLPLVPAPEHCEGCVRPVALPRFDDLALPVLWADERIVLDRDPPRLLIGLCWHGSGGGRSAVGLDDDPRCIPVELLRPLLAVPGLQFVALQQADWAPALRALPESEGIPDLAGLGVQDWADTAGIIQQLDLVITIDSAVAHLAGNLGAPTWLLLISPRHPAWDQGRWGRQPPLYPAVRQIRQPEPGDWASVVTQLCSEVALLSVARAIA